MEITYKDKIIKAQKGTKIKEVLKEEIETKLSQKMAKMLQNNTKKVLKRH